MATARKNASKAEELRVSQIGDFKQRLGGILELPSGLVVRWRNPGGMRAFLSQGVIPNSLLPIIENALNNRQGVENIEVADLLKDPEKLSEMMAMFDHVALTAIIEPKFHKVPTWDDVRKNNEKFPEAPVEEPEDLRSDDQLYIDELPDDDKQYLFQLISGGVKDLATFRERHTQNMGAVAKVSGVTGYSVEDSGTN